jgi:hypothetical protein
MLLWMTIIYGFIKICVKPSSAYIDNAKQHVMVQSGHRKFGDVGEHL